MKSAMSALTPTSFLLNHQQRLRNWIDQSNQDNHSFPRHKQASKLHSLRNIPHLVHEMAYLLSSFMTVQSAICVTLSDITSDMLYKNPASCAKIGLLETMIAWNEASQYADRKIVTGTLQEVIDTTEAFLNCYIADG